MTTVYNDPIVNTLTVDGFTVTGRDCTWTINVYDVAPMSGGRQPKVEFTLTLNRWHQDRKFPYTDMGLAMAQRFVELAHRKRIPVRCQHDDGLAFDFNLSDLDLSTLNERGYEGDMILFAKVVDARRTA